MGRKYDRQMELINYLSRGQRVTYASLSHVFSVSIKTIKKDVAELSLYFPLDTYLGCAGGVEMRRGYIINGYIMKRQDLQILSDALDELKKTRKDPEIAKLLSMLVPKSK